MRSKTNKLVTGEIRYFRAALTRLYYDVVLDCGSCGGGCGSSGGCGCNSGTVVVVVVMLMLIAWRKVRFSL